MKVFSLIDITETKQHRNKCDDKIMLNQQANFNTFFQTLALRANCYYDNPPRIIEMSEEELRAKGFGTAYKGKQRVWLFEYTIETAVAGQSVKGLQDDFNLVPVIPDLTETILVNNNIFRTDSKEYTNIIFEAE